MYIFVRMKIKQGKSTHNAADALSRKNKSDMRINFVQITLLIEKTYKKQSFNRYF